MTLSSRCVLLVIVAVAGCTAGATDPPAKIPAELAPGTARQPMSHVSVDSVSHTVSVYLGPFEVPAADPAMAGMPHDMVGHHSPLVEFTWPVEGWFRGYRLTLVDEHGTEIPRRVMHHLIGYNLERPQLLHPGVERLFALGQETGDIVLPTAIGVPVTRGSQLAVNVTWHNESGRSYAAAYVRLVLPYLPASGGTPIEGLPFHADVNYQIATTTAFDLPPGKSQFDHEFVMPVDGGIVGISGHLHDYGVAVRLEDAESGAVLFSLPTTRDSSGHVLRIEQRIFRSWFGLRDARVPLIAGHRYRVVGEYDNPTGKTIPAGAMAHVAGLFAPTDLAKWPTLELSDSLVQEDLRVLRGEARPSSAMRMPPHEHQHPL